MEEIVQGKQGKFFETFEKLDLIDQLRIDFKDIEGVQAGSFFKSL